MSGRNQRIARKLGRRRRGAKADPEMNQIIQSATEESKKVESQGGTRNPERSYKGATEESYKSHGAREELESQKGPKEKPQGAGEKPENQGGVRGESDALKRARVEPKS